MKKLILFISAVTLLASCKNEKPSISDLTWLEGKWVGTSQGLKFFEEWQPLKGNLLAGAGWALSDQDTVFFEKVRIEQRGEDLFYIASVDGNDGDVDFKFTGYKNDSMVFENPKHDFPQRVVYFRNPDGKLYACVDGKDKGTFTRIEFSYQKEK
jgi:uncharacterized protein DUF6265